MQCGHLADKGLGVNFWRFCAASVMNDPYHLYKNVLFQQTTVYTLCTFGIKLKVNLK